MSAALTLTQRDYLDKVKGAWWGKCAGITLGAPTRGRTVPSTLRYYTPIPSQHTAGVGLDFTVVWLHALEQVGPSIAEDDLIKAWQNHLNYWHDEFGFAQWNWAHGLEPPASGTYSNWFLNSTGGAMRADLWALLLPGSPQKAAAFAARDARIDHGMEGVWAAMFLAAIGSAAFFLSDPLTLFVIGLAMVPRTCRVARAVKAVLATAHKGADGLAAREAVLKEVGHSNFSDAAQNIGFFAIGLLYGFQDFGSALCSGVNCGYDTEFVGGAIGAIKGILYGYQRLPKEWVEPLGRMFIPGAGLHDLPLPDSLESVAERIAGVGSQFIQAHVPHLSLVDEVQIPVGVLNALPNTSELTTQAEGGPVTIETPPPSPQAPLESVESTPSTAETAATASSAQTEPIITQQAPNASTETASTPAVVGDVTQAIAWADNRLVKPLLVHPPYLVERNIGPYCISLDAGDVFAISHLQPKTFQLAVANQGQEPFIGQIQVSVPSGWQVSWPVGFGNRQVIAPQGLLRIPFTLSVPEGKGVIELSNSISITLVPEKEGEAHTAQFTIPGASCWWVVGAFENADTEGFDRVYAPEDRPALHEIYTGRLGQLVRWERRSFPELSFDLDPLFHNAPGVCYGQTVFYAPSERSARLIAATNSGVKVWLNSRRVLARFERKPFRPTPIGSPWAADVRLLQGANRVLVKWVRGKDPFAFSLFFTDLEGRLMPDVGNTRW